MVAQKTTPKNKKKQPQSRPFQEAGSILGHTVGSLFGNASFGRNIGKWLGSGIGSILGSGDYQMVGESPKYNVLTSSKQIPQFSTTKQTNIVCHREYLGDIAGTTGFNNVGYPLNPGVATTFPWLSTVAQNYQEYRIHGLIFEFRPLITDFVTSGAPGVVIMATNYNAAVPTYTTKQQMENSEYAVSVKPTLPLIHAVECDKAQTVLSELYVRTGTNPVNQDLRLYDMGLFQFATQQNPNQNLGELWVSYCVEFFKPELPPDVGGDTASGHAARTNISSTSNALGLVQRFNVGDLALTVLGTSVNWIGQPGQQYQVTIYWNGSSVVLNIGSVVPAAGLASRIYYTNDTLPSGFAPSNGSTTNTLMFSSVLVCTLLAPGPCGISITGATVPVGEIDIFVTEFSNQVSN